MEGSDRPLSESLDPSCYLVGVVYVMSCGCAAFGEDATAPFAGRGKTTEARKLLFVWHQTGHVKKNLEWVLRSRPFHMSFVEGDRAWQSVRQARRTRFSFCCA